MKPNIKFKKCGSAKEAACFAQIMQNCKDVIDSVPFEVSEGFHVVMTSVQPKESKRIRKRPVGPAAQSAILKRLFGIEAPAIFLDRKLGHVERNQKILHLNTRDIIPIERKADLGIPVDLVLPQINERIHTKLVGQFRFGKGSRKAGPWEKLFKQARTGSIVIKEQEVEGKTEFVVVVY